MKKHEVKHPQKIIAVRLPMLTYNRLVLKSYEEEISVSALIRNVLIGFLNTDNSELEKIRCYGATKAKALIESIENKQLGER